MRNDLRSLSDQELVRLCIERGHADDRPFAELFRRYHRLVWSVCYSWFSNRQDAEDLTQDSFLKAFRSLRQFEGRSSLSSWLFRVATNTCHNERRRRGRRPMESEDDRPSEEHTMAASDGPHLELTKREEIERLDRAIARLPSEEREILLLAEYAQTPYKTIAQQLGLSVSAVKMRVLRARAALRRAFLEEETQ